MRVLELWFAACRLKQWTKNLLVAVGPFFAFSYTPAIWIPTAVAVLAFCLLSSATYLVNDCIDISADRRHPRKCLRPIAAGLIPRSHAISAAALLAATAFLLASLLRPGLLILLVVYALLQLAYSLRLKQLPLLDLFSIASGFLLRALAGPVAASLSISPWFLLTIGLLAMFLAIEKRKAELRLLPSNAVPSRPVLSRYSLELLLRLESLVATSAFMCYSLWASGPRLGGASTSWMLLSVPFVLAGIFRYQLLSDPAEAYRREQAAHKTSAERPEDILLHDRGIQLILLGWLLTSAGVSVSQSI